jgi:acyl carrier protein
VNELRSRLIECFAIVFPSLNQQEIPNASLVCVDSWDSLTSATLIATVEEEFGIRVAAHDLDQFVSFDLILDYLGTHKLGSNT